MSEDAAAAPEESGEQSDETLGGRLRTAREARDLSIEKIADELRIEEHILYALEEDRLDEITVAPVFVKGYIKQYGRLLELDYEELREAYHRQAKSDDVRLLPNRAIHLRDERQITIWVIAALAALLVAVALFVWWLGAEESPIAETFGNSGEPESVSVAAPITARTEPLSPPVTTEVPESQVAEVPVAAPAEQSEGDVADIVRQPEVSQTVAAETDAQAESNDAVSSEVIALPLEPEPGSVTMLFEFSAESWFELTDARDRRLHYDLAASGSRLSFSVLPPARVLLGDASAVSVTVGDEAFAVPASSRRGNVASFVIDPAQD